MNDKENILKIVKIYKDFLVGSDITSHQADLNSVELTELQKFEHLLYMLDKIIEQDDIEKSNRWIGFIQGVLWSLDVFSIEDLRGHVLTIQLK